MQSARKIIVIKHLTIYSMPRKVKNHPVYQMMKERWSVVCQCLFSCQFVFWCICINHESVSVFFCCLSVFFGCLTPFSLGRLVLTTFCVPSFAQVHISNLYTSRKIQWQKDGKKWREKEKNKREYSCGPYENFNSRPALVLNAAGFYDISTTSIFTPPLLL